MRNLNNFEESAVEVGGICRGFGFYGFDTQDRSRTTLPAPAMPGNSVLAMKQVVRMLMTILLDSRGELVAAGPTCDQMGVGKHYWHDVLGLESQAGGYETVVIQVADSTIVQQLVSFHVEQDPQTRRHVRDLLALGYDLRPSLRPIRLAA